MADITQLANLTIFKTKIKSLEIINIIKSDISKSQCILYYNLLMRAQKD